MKVVGIVGSGRSGGNTETLTRIALEEIQKEGLETELISLAGKRIEGCDGCRTCLETGQCHIRDDFESVFTKMKEADGIILATPVYYGAATPQMTSLISARAIRVRFLLLYELEGCQKAVDFLTKYCGIRRMKIKLNGRKVGNGDIAVYFENKAHFTKRGLNKRTVLHELYHHLAYINGVEMPQKKEERAANC